MTVMENRLRVLDDTTRQLADACVHCGLCLATCPTYIMTGDEAESPRGRIELIKAVDDGVLPADETTTRHLANCLDCRACETACPSGVVYHRLIEQAHEKWPRLEGQSWALGGLAGWLVRHVMTEPWRLKLALLPMRVAQKTGLWKVAGRLGMMKLLPSTVTKLAAMAGDGSKIGLWPGVSRAGHPAKSADIALVVTCIGGVMMPEVDEAALAVMSKLGLRAGVSAMGCCGAIDHHNGRPEQALELARRNIEIAETEAGGTGPIACTVAGCGAMLRQYAELLESETGTDWPERARRFSSRVRDISEVVQPALTDDHRWAVRGDETVAYHGACHLAHGQRVNAPPLDMLRASGRAVRVLGAEAGEAELCCGAAGTYNLSHAAEANALGDRKLAALRGSDGVLAVGNVGCLMHLRARAVAQGAAVRVAHPIELVAESLGIAGK